MGPGTRVAMEEPGYPEARDVFRGLSGAEVVASPVDSDGLDVSAIPKGADCVS